MTAPAFVIRCTTCSEDGVRYRIRETCSECAETSMHHHRTSHPGHVVTLTETVDTPPRRDGRTTRLLRSRW